MLNHKLFLILVSLSLMLLAIEAIFEAPAVHPETITPADTPQPYSPSIYFIPNANEKHFSTTHHDTQVLFDVGRITLRFATGEIVDINFPDSNPTVTPQGQQPTTALAHDYRGNTPAQWRENIPLYTQVIYQNLYPGIDLLYYFAEGQLKSEFIVHPGAKMENIRIRYTGIENLSATAGDLHITVNSDLTLRETIPYAYQEINRQRYTVTAKFQLINAYSYGFVMQENRLPGAALVIDPVLSNATYLGGSMSDEAWAITTDYAGNSYVTGITWSQDFPVLNPTQPSLVTGENKDTFIAKFDVQGALVYATYYGGSVGEEGNAIAVDTDGNAYVAGETYSNDLPVHNAWQSAFAGHEDAYVLKLDALGKLQWATYLGGKGFEEANAITVDQIGRIYVGGEVYSDDFPLINPWSSNTYGEGDEDGFIAIFNPEGQLIYSTYISAPQRDQIFALTVDQNGYVYAAGMTSSSDFPVQNAVQPHYGGGWEDGLVLKLDPWNNKMHFATFLGGQNRDACWGIDYDQEGNLYLSGYTSSTNFPTVNAYQTTKKGSQPDISDAFVAKLDSSGTQLRYATYLGGSGVDRSWGIVSDHLGNTYLIGQTSSTDFPMHNALQPSFGGGSNDGFIAIFDPMGTLYYTSYLGGSGQDKLWGIALDGNWIAHVAGQSSSPLLSTTNAYQQHNAGESDAFVGHLAFIPTPTPTPTPTPYASAQIGPDGGVLWLSYPTHLTMLQVPQGALSDATTFELVYDGRVANQGTLQGIDHFFYLNIAPPENVRSPLQMDLAYQRTYGVDVDTINLYHLAGSAWVTDNITITGQNEGYITAWIKQAGVYGLLGQTNRIYLPIIMR
ncbi:MAG: SBBP repeat-containing protein [Chloroflexota bacterium]|nr:SBBP repeat-containing protein [Chloroflexota bacterium]